MTISGPGNLALSGANKVTGTNTLNSGTLTLTANNAATGAYTLTGGVLQATNSLAVGGAVTLSNSSVTIAGSSPIAFTGVMTVNGLNNTLTVSNTALTTLGGVIQDGSSPARSLTKLGTGTLVMTGVNTYTGQTDILGGIVNIQNSSAIGSQQ